MTTQNEVLDDFVYRVALDRASVIEERVRVIVQPKPRWLPRRIWNHILARVLYLEHS